MPMFVFLWVMAESSSSGEESSEEEEHDEVSPNLHRPVCTCMLDKGQP